MKDGIAQALNAKPDATDLYVIEPSNEWFVAGQPIPGLIAGVLINISNASWPEAEVRSLSIDFGRSFPVGPVQIRRVAAPASRSTAAFLVGDGLAIATARRTSATPRALVTVGTEPIVHSRPAVSYRPFVSAKHSPRFLEFFEHRPMMDRPGAAPPRPGWEGVWIRPRHNTPFDQALLALISSTWMPALYQELAREQQRTGHYMLEPGPLPVATWAVYFTARMPGPMSDRVLLLQRLTTASTGLVVEDEELWSESSELLALVRTSYEPNFATATN